MNIEYEAKVLEINVNKLRSKLEELGAVLIGEYNQKRYVYDMVPAVPNRWIRLRTNGSETTLTMKNIEKDSINGTKEIEIVVSNFEKTNELLKEMGYYYNCYQENKRIKYMLNDVEIDIDFWPLIPPYLEIEGKDEESVKKMMDLLEVDKEKVTYLSVKKIYKENYNIDLHDIKELRFN